METHVHLELIQAIPNSQSIPRTLFISTKSRPTLALLAMRGLTLRMHCSTDTTDIALHFQMPHMHKRHKLGFAGTSGYC
eukprot:1138845-Pelagomonas_calceolata.AAC.2